MSFTVQWHLCKALNIDVSTKKTLVHFLALIPFVFQLRLKAILSVKRAFKILSAVVCMIVLQASMIVLQSYKQGSNPPPP